MQKPILVTGSNNPGITWIGEIIGASDQIRVIQEPFNLSVEKYQQPFSHNFEFISRFCSQDHQDKVFDYMRAFYDSTDNQRTLFNAPFAIMSSAWLYQHLDCDVIVNISHPLTFVANFKNDNIDFDFDNFLDQKNLMRVFLSEFYPEIEASIKNVPNKLEQGILLWNAIHSAILVLQKEYATDWVFIREEDLIQSPMTQFPNIFEHLNVPIKEEVHSMLEKFSSHTAADKKQLLTAEEINIIKEKTKTLRPHFYSEE